MRGQHIARDGHGMGNVTLDLANGLGGGGRAQRHLHDRQAALHQRLRQRNRMVQPLDGDERHEPGGAENGEGHFALGDHGVLLQLC